MIWRRYQALQKGLKDLLMNPAYLASWKSGSFLRTLEGVLDRFSPCRLCPRQCNAARTDGEAGLCGQASLPRVARALPHFGEEPPLTGRFGAGAVFFSGCALRCVYCQNHQISQENLGEEINTKDLADLFLELQAKGCHNLDLVSPTPHLPFIFQALAIAIPRRLRIPIAYNTHGFLTSDVIDLLSGIVDIYLPDMKYGSEESAKTFSMAPGYVAVNRSAVEQIYQQAGPLDIGPDGIAQKGLLVRHLVLPNHAFETAMVLEALSRISTRIPLSLMAQYLPCHRAGRHPVLNRPITDIEYQQALESAQELGFETLFIQSLESSDIYFPDFIRKDPFSHPDPAVFP